MKRSAPALGVVDPWRLGDPFSRLGDWLLLADFASRLGDDNIDVDVNLLGDIIDDEPLSFEGVFNTFLDFDGVFLSESLLSRFLLLLLLLLLPWPLLLFRVAEMLANKLDEFEADVSSALRCQRATGPLDNGASILVTLEISFSSE